MDGSEYCSQVFRVSGRRQLTKDVSSSCGMRASVRCNGVELLYGGEGNERLLSR